jgi:hypothetical protein
MMRGYLFCISFLCALGHGSANGQTIKFTFAEVVDSKIVVHYELEDSVASRLFTIRLYSSLDNYINPLEEVSGDIGYELKPGSDKKIVWDAKRELGEKFDVGVSLEIKGKIFIPFISLDQINQYEVFKRKRAYNLTWSGGKPTNVLNFDLINRKGKVMTFPNIANVGYHSFEFPTFVKPGLYHFKIADVKNKDEVVTSRNFRVKRKIPIVAKVIGAGIIGFMAAMLPRNVSDDRSLPAAPIPRNK